MWRRSILVLLALATQLSCETTTHSVPVLGDFDITHTSATRAWFVLDQGEIIGELVRFDDAEGVRFFYSVRNPLHQEFGLIDEAGRAYRFRPHQEEPSWVGTGAVLRGVRQILGSSEAAELREIELTELTRTR